MPDGAVLEEDEQGALVALAHYKAAVDCVAAVVPHLDPFLDRSLVVPDTVLTVLLTWMSLLERTHSQ